MTRLILTQWCIAAQVGEVDAVELNVEARVNKIAGGVVSEVQPLAHHHHHHPQPRPPGGGLHTAGLSRVQGAVTRGLHHDDTAGKGVHRVLMVLSGLNSSL